MGIIDFRIRPLISGYKYMTENKESCQKFLTAFRSDVPQSVKEQSVELLVREMDEAGVDLAVIPERQSPQYDVPNEELVALMDKFPGRFMAFPLYDPLRPQESLREIKDLVLHGPCRGVSAEPGFGNTLRFDDEAFTPLYEFLNARSIPFLTTFSGSITPTIDPSLPGRFQAVANAYPNIPMIAGHGGWPWVREMCCAAFFTPNIYLVPDLYSVNCPSQDDARLAADNILRDRMLFGSSYPLLSVKTAVDNAKGWNLQPDAAKLFFHDTAARLLGLTI